MHGAQDDLKIKRFSVKRHMVLLNPGSHRWPPLSSGHKTKPKDMYVGGREGGRRGKGTKVGGDEKHSIHASVITKHVIQRLFYIVSKSAGGIHLARSATSKKPSKFYFIDRG